jgi:peroxiredoxin
MGIHGLIGLMLIAAAAGVSPSALASLAPTFLQGKDFTQSAQTTAQLDYRHAKRGTVVLFLSARCPCSASHEERIKDLYDHYSKLGFQFVGVHSNQDEPMSEALSHFKKTSFPFPILDDAGAVIANQLGALKTPHSYIINPSGEILYQGGVDDSHDASSAKKFYLETALEQVLAGETPSPSEVRVLGCVIRR